MYRVTEECIACGTCLPECEFNAIEEGEERYTINENCTDCGTCAEICPTEAIVSGEE